ncbi:signal peptidase I [Phormidium sp. CCY1219]|uniref:signal peptidase I n=1 Tax=Phormidium sp. CCY1219 TaxID=2886104 RepID=UPI002D1F4C47|nr:signal peptidase I [Phormidium sp. CCY1219]MEB3827818.1 signal peptidase I [Phormidium sp. CCY1219]
MTSAKLQAQAKKGNPKAIAALLERQFKSQSLRAKVRLTRGCLQVILSSPQLSDRQVYISAIAQLLMTLNVKGIRRVKILAKYPHQKAPSWTHDFLLPTPSPAHRRVPGRRKNSGTARRRPRALHRRPTQKDPWLAVNLSVLLPGLGQCYAGKLLRGLGFFVVEAILLAIALATFFSPTGNSLTSFGLLFPIFIFYIINIIDAHKCFRTISFSQLENVLKNKRNRNNPWVAVFLSQILPGLGHLYLNKMFLGAVFLIGLILASNVARVYEGWIVVPPLMYAIAAYHAYFLGSRGQGDRPEPIVWVVALIVTLKVSFILLPAGVEHHFVQRFTIPSNSMQPTLQAGDRILVRKSPDYRPQFGDVVVFRAPKFAQQLDPNAGELFIKRVIGTPLEVVSLQDGIFYINDRPLQENYLGSLPTYPFDRQLVPEDSYFVLGDNRDESFDSHVWGFVPRKDIIGQAYKIYWPRSRIGAIESVKQE